MQFGITIPILRNVEAHANIEIAKRAEGLGFDSIWASDHIIVPNQYVGRFSETFYDPFVILASIAAYTSKIKLGTSVIVLPYRNPIAVAKAAATLDALSNGRLIFGVASGWLKEEFDILSVSFHERGKRTDEYIRIFKELWENYDPKFEGEFYSFSDIKFYPKPYQKPRPPIWIGGNSRKAIRRAVELGDGWQPVGLSPEEMEGELNYLKRIANEWGRESSTIVFSLRSRLHILSTGEKQSGKIESRRHPFLFYGTSEEITDYIWRFKDIGISHIALDVLARSDEEMFDIMERFSREIMPAF
ncbi:MAG: LLM class F420-dependent oxidoreductase [Candidatus Dadabacteria bacterium]